MNAKVQCGKCQSPDCETCFPAPGVIYVTPPNADLEIIPPQLTGGSSSYYKLPIPYPITLPDPYVCECTDIIEALGMTFAEGNVFKALWRNAAKRQGNGKSGTTSVYDAEKMVFFSKIILDQEKRK